MDKEVIDFNDYDSVEEAVNKWLKLDLALKAAINVPTDLPNQDGVSQIHQHDSMSASLVKQELPSPSCIPFTSYLPNVRTRRNPFQSPGEGKQETINPPFPWATDRRATFYPLQRLIADGLTSIPGEVQCKQCNRRDTMSLDLQSKFKEVENFVREIQFDLLMHRAPPEWLNPVFEECSSCKEPNCMKPVLADTRKQINWLFLFLSQTLGFCSLKQLKWLCKHTHNHRSGQKDRVLYYSYISIGKQLDPSGVFARLPTTQH